MPKKERSIELKRLEIKVGEKIKNILKEKHLSEKEFRFNAWDHYDYNGVTKRLNGAGGITTLDIKKASKYLGVSSDYLLGLTDQKTAPSSTEKKPITAKKFCEVLLNLLDSSFPWTLIEVPCKETGISVVGTEYEETVNYPAIYFKEYRGYSYQFYTDENGIEQYGLRENTNETPSRINSFIRKATKYRKWLDDNDMDIDREEYEDFLEKQLSKLSE